MVLESSWQAGGLVSWFHVQPVECEKKQQTNERKPKMIIGSSVLPPQPLPTVHRLSGSDFGKNKSTTKTDKPTNRSSLYAQSSVQSIQTSEVPLISPNSRESSNRFSPNITRESIESHSVHHFGASNQLDPTPGQA